MDSRFRRVVRRVSAFAGGAVLLQVSGCAVDDTLLTELANFAVDAILASLFGII